MLNSAIRRYKLHALAAFLAVGAAAHHASAAPLPAVSPLSVTQSIGVTLASDNEVLPSQRPRYLSASARSVDSRFGQTAGTPNPWGLTHITPNEGVITLRPGETYATAGDQDLRGRAAGATYGHAIATGVIG